MWPLNLLLALGTLASARTIDQMPLKRGSPSSSPSNGEALRGLELRMLPLGASITYGYHSTSGNGYRLDLENLIKPFADVTYIGSQCSGSMENGNNEGHPGFVIDQMESVSAVDLPQRPNVILVYVGTNDMVYPDAPTTAPQRMGQLVTYLAKACPDAAIIVGNLFLDTNPVVNARINTFNQNLPPVIKSLQANGTKVLMADLHSALNKNDLFCDGEHPIDQGYAKMADVFFGSLIEAAVGGLIHNPVSGNVSSPVHCTPTAPTGAGTCSSTTAASSLASSTTMTTTHAPTTTTHTTTVTHTSTPSKSTTHKTTPHPSATSKAAS